MLAELKTSHGHTEEPELTAIILEVAAHNMRIGDEYSVKLIAEMIDHIEKAAELFEADLIHDDEASHTKTLSHYVGLIELAARTLGREAAAQVLALVIATITKSA